MKISALPSRVPSRVLLVGAITVAGALLVLWPNLAVARRDPTIEVPKEIVAQLLEEGYEIEVSAGGTASNLEAHPMELNRGGEPELRVHGLGTNICGAANCMNWVYQKVGDGYRLLLDGGSINRIEPQRARTKGYRDLVAVRHVSALESDLALYRFDGERYQRESCFLRIFRYEDKHGTLREWKQPKVTRIDCDPEEDL